MIFSSLTDFDDTKEYGRSRNFYSFFHFRNFGPQNFLKIDFFQIWQVLENLGKKQQQLINAASTSLSLNLYAAIRPKVLLITKA